ncbi:MAG TPA: molecular chaperone DnaJ [Candidatus Binatia bacterium]|nr:molecular chaperone DnaJ [Candidatus Binatia bacterium]
MAQDFYQTLGVSKTATPEEIKKAYRRLAHEHHPDKGQGDPEKFKQINEAYQVLSDPDKRARYDQFGSAYQQTGRQGGGFGGFDPSNFDFGDFGQYGFGGQPGFEDAFDIFSDIFGGGRRASRQRGIDLEMEINLTFEEAVFGVEKEISIEKKDTCVKCSGSGAEPGSKVTTCPKCHGQGQIRTTRRTILGNMATVSTCDQCRGTGKFPEVACKECRGSGQLRRTKTIKVKIPAGVDDGSRVRVTGEGEVGYRGSNSGDLYLRLNVKNHPTLKREGEHIYSETPISFYQAALGTSVDVKTLDGEVNLKIPSGTQSGKVFRLKGKGVPIVNSSSRGDHYVTIHVVTPTKLSKKEKELFKKLAEEKGETVEVDEGFWSKFVG